ncbi:MAG: AtpZ/AtpI family protein [Anaerolineae bacterium]
MKLDRSTWRAMAAATQLGTAVAASLGLAMGGGYLLDRWLGTRPVFLLLGIVVGLIAAAYTIADLAKQFGDDPERRDPDS